MKTHRRILGAASALVLAQFAMNSVQAVVVLNETFEQITVGSPVTTTNSVFTSQVGTNNGGAAGSLIVRNANPPALPAGNTNPFTGTNYLHFSDGTARPVLNGPAVIGPETTFRLSFDHFLAINSGAAGNANMGILLGNGLQSLTNSIGVRSFALTFIQASTTTMSVAIQGGDTNSSGPAQSTLAITPNAMHHYEVVGNLLSSSVNYTQAGAQSLLPNTVDLFVDGSLVLDDAPFRHIPYNPATPSFDTPLNTIGIVQANGASAAIADFYLDNLMIETEALGAAIQLIADRDTGTLTLTNPTGLTGAFDILGYSIKSNYGALDQAGWKNVANNYDQGNPGPDQFDVDSQWTILTGAGKHTDLSEVTLSGNGGELAATESLVLSQGNGAWIPTPTQDLVMELLLANGTTRNVPVLYTGNSSNPFLRSDLDTDGDIDPNDFVLYNAGLFTTLPTNSKALAYLQGDLNGDGFNDQNDFLLFKADYIAANGAPAFAALADGAVVPEPSTIALLVIGACGLLVAGQRRLASGALVLIAVAATTPANALDLIAQTGFNDASGINSNGTANSPYESGVSIAGGPGAGEPGWTTPWQWTYATNMGSAAPQATVTFEGDMALQIDAAGGGSASTFNRAFDAQLPGHIVNISTRIRVDNFTTGNVTMYLLDATTGLQAAVFSSDTDGSVKAISGANTLEAFPAGSIALGAWAQLEARANIATQKYTVSLNGVDSGMTFDFRQAAAKISGVQSWTNATLSYIDEIVISEVPHDTVEQLQLKVNTSTGEISIVNPFSGDYSMDFYKITGANSLVFNNWDSLDDQNIGVGQGWLQAGGSSNSLLSETYLSSTTLSSDDELSLGLSYNKTLDNQDLVFTYHDIATGKFIDGYVDYITSLDGDYNGDNKVDAADYSMWRDTFQGGNPAGYTTWKANFGAGNGSGSAMGGNTSIPEPAAWLLCLPAICFALLLRGRQLATAKAFAALAVALLATSSSFAVVTGNRYYTMGDSPDELAMVNGAGSAVGSNFPSPSDVLDSDTNSGFADLGKAGDPRYANVGSSMGGLSRPGAADGSFGITFNDASSDYLSVTALNAPGTAGDGFDTQGLQLWVYPTDNNRRQGIVFDGTSVGAIAITPDGKWTQSFSNRPNNTDILPTVPVVTNAWSHVMQHVYRFVDAGGPAVDTTLGAPSTFTSVVYVNGIAVSASNDNGVASTGSFLVGAEGATPANFFEGTLDDLKVYTVTSNSFNLFEDNDYIAGLIDALNLPGDGLLHNGDVTRDGDIDQDDVDAFVAGWLMEKKFGGGINDVYAGDWETWGWGDMNHDGRVSLADAFLLHQGLLGSGAGGFDFGLLSGNGPTVPEPSAAILAIIGLAALAVARRWKR